MPIIMSLFLITVFFVILFIGITRTEEKSFLIWLEQFKELHADKIKESKVEIDEKLMRDVYLVSDNHEAAWTIYIKYIEVTPGEGNNEPHGV